MNKLLPHEETLKGLYTELISEMGRDTVQRDPIIVDKGSMTVLDGMHRLRALRELGATGVACNLVDYSDEGLRLMRWTRCVAAPSAGLISRLVKELQLSHRGAAFEGLTLINSNKSASGLIFNDNAFLRIGTGGAAETVRKFDHIAEEEEARVSFVDEPSLAVAMRTRDIALFVIPKLEKREVMDAARKSQLFPHKTTMHQLRVRPLGVNVPLSELQEGAGTYNLTALRERPMRIIEPPAKYMGRIYSETLVVLS